MADNILYYHDSQCDQHPIVLWRNIHFTSIVFMSTANSFIRGCVYAWTLDSWACKADMNALGSFWSGKDWFRHKRMFSEKRKSHLIPGGPIHPAAAVELALFVYLCLEKKFIRFSHFDPQWTRHRENCFYKYFFFEQSQIILYHLIWAEKSEWFIKGFMGFCGYETFHHKIFWSSSLISFRGL